MVNQAQTNLQRVEFVPYAKVCSLQNVFGTSLYQESCSFFPNAFMVSECIYITKTTMTLKNCQNWSSKTLQLTGIPPCKIFGEKSGALEEE